MRKNIISLLLVVLAVCLLSSCVISPKAKELPDSVKFGSFNGSAFLTYEFGKDETFNWKYYAAGSLVLHIEDLYSFSPTLSFNLSDDYSCYKTKDFLTNITSYKDLVSLEKMYAPDGSGCQMLVNLEDSLVYMWTDGQHSDVIIFKANSSVFYYYESSVHTLIEGTYSITESNGLVLTINDKDFSITMSNGTKITSFEILENLESIKDDYCTYTQMFNYID